MPAIPVIIKGITYAVNALIVAGVIKDIIDWFRGNSDAEKALAATAEETGNSLDDVKQVRAGVLYERIEKEGGNPDDFWNGLPQDVRDEIKFSPEAVKRSMDRTSFLGMASALAWIGAAAAALFAGARGVPIATKYLSRVIKATEAGKGAAEVSNILNEARLVSISKIGIPGIIAGVLGAAGWQVGGWANNLNDVDFWGRVNLQQAEDDFNKMQAQLARGSGSGSGGSYTPQSYTRVQTSKTAKPKLFTGTFFSGKLGKFEQFVRQQDDQITSFNDMLDDIEINLKRWYEKLPGMLNYDLVVVNQPKDELGMTKTGTWVVLNLYLTNSWHKRMLLENILLGPVDPAVYYPDSQTIYSVNLSVPKILTPEDIEKLELPSGREYTVDKDGNVVAGFFGGYGTKIQGGSGVDIADKIIEASKEIAKATEGVAEQKAANVPAGHIEIPEGTQAIDKATGGFLFSTGKGAIIKESDIIQRNGREIDTYGIKYVLPAGYVSPTGQVAGAIAPAPQTSAPATGATPPVSQGANLVQPFPRTIVVKVNGLAVRSAPNTSAPLAGSQRLNSGDRFVATALVTGEMVEGVNLWWKSEFGNYVWSGGTQ